MNAQEYWKIFVETGSPEAYMLYSKAKKVETINASNNKSVGIKSNRLQ